MKNATKRLQISLFMYPGLCPKIGVENLTVRVESGGFVQTKELSEQELREKRCSCGYDIDHHMVSKEGVYTLIGKFWVLFGVTTEPIAIKYRCRRCHELFGMTSDKKILKRDI